MTHQTISPKDAYDLISGGKAVLIDVRDPDEFSQNHILYAQSIPLSHIDDIFDHLSLPSDRKIIMQCLSGKRGEQACAIIGNKGISQEIFNIEGGISAWQAAGLPIIGKPPQKLSIFRQVQMIVGALIFTLIMLGLWGIGVAFIIAGIFAAALTFAGITGWCGLAMLLQHMPWNTPKTHKEKKSCCGCG